MFDSMPLFLARLYSFLSYELVKIGEVSLTPQKLIIALFSIWASHKLAYAVEGALRRSLMKKDFDPGAKVSMERFTRYGVFTVGVIVTLSYVGVNLRTLETFGAVLGVGIGFGLQNITQNFISGLILLTERPIKRGDLVVVDGISGRVLDIRARSTLVLTRDDVVIIVPNSEFITKQVVNQSFSGERIRYAIQVGVAYGTDLKKAQEILLAIAKKHPQVLQTPPPSVQLREFGLHAIDFSLRIWLSELWFNEVILSELRFEIDKQFAENGIFIPYQQPSATKTARDKNT